MMTSSLFGKLSDGLTDVKRDLQRVAKCCDAKATGDFDKVDRRTLQFLDTPDCTFQNNGLILRHRRMKSADDNGEMTLKCRNEDRYLSAGIKVNAAKKYKPLEKFEEDIAAPFRSRFSRSVTILSPSAKLPKTVAEAAKRYPILGTLGRDGGQCDGLTPVQTVNNFVPYEQVHKGMKLVLPNAICTVALILWSNTPKSRIICAEFSFRYGNKDEKYSTDTARAAYNLFTAIQKIDWCQVDGTTKTQFAYQS
jgi:hypothetical protein